MCSLCAGLFERMEYCEEHGLARVGQLVRDALAEHGSRRHDVLYEPVAGDEQFTHKETPYRVLIRQEMGYRENRNELDD